MLLVDLVDLIDSMLRGQELVPGVMSELRTERAEEKSSKNWQGKSRKIKESNWKQLKATESNWKQLKATESRKFLHSTGSPWFPYIMSRSLQNVIRATSSSISSCARSKTLMIIQILCWSRETFCWGSSAPANPLPWPRPLESSGESSCHGEYTQIIYYIILLYHIMCHWYSLILMCYWWILMCHLFDDFDICWQPVDIDPFGVHAHPPCPGGDPLAKLANPLPPGPRICHGLAMACS